VRSRNRLGYHDAPTQLKMFLWSKGYHVNPYFFAPAGNERSGFHETDAGALAEVDVLGYGRTIVGLNGVHGTSRLLNRTMIGPYARLGFGTWGILGGARYYVANDAQCISRFVSAAGQLWTGALGGEGMAGARKHGRETERGATVPGGAMMACGGQSTVRLTPHFTLALSARAQHNQLNGRTSPAITLSLNIKTPN
jgi:hypothetical protein